MTDSNLTATPKIHSVEDLESLIATQNEKINTLDSLLTRLAAITEIHHTIFVRQGICGSLHSLPNSKQTLTFRAPQS